MLRQQLAYAGYGGAPAYEGYPGFGAVTPCSSQAVGYPAPQGPSPSPGCSTPDQPWTGPTA